MPGAPVTAPSTPNSEGFSSVHWLIEVDVFPVTASGITAALDARGQRWSRWHDQARADELPPTSLPTLFWGSLGAAYGPASAPWRPGAIGDVHSFTCSEYTSRLTGINITNGRALHTTVAKLVASPAPLLAELGPTTHVFVRPESPLKPFSGRVLAINDLSLEALDHGFYYDNTDLPIAVSLPRHIAREWRFVIAKGQVITGCEYIASRRGAGQAIPRECNALASRVARHSWQPAAIYVVDIAQVDGEFAVMELNPFSGADFYDCDPQRIVEAASRVAAELFTKS